MPRLPERRTKAKQPDSKARSSRSTNAPSRTVRKPLQLGPSWPPEQQQEQALERTLAGLLAYSGLLGTIATGVSMVCPDVDLFGNFNLNPADITLGLQLLLPCCLLNLAIMLPDYSSWKVPAEPTLEEQQRMAESLLAWSTRQKSGAAGSSSSSSSSLNGRRDEAGAAGIAAQHSRSNSSDAMASTSVGSSTSTDDQTAAVHSANPMQTEEAATTTSSSGTSTSQLEGSTSTTSHPSSSSSSPAHAGSVADGTAGPAAAPPWLVNDPDPPLPLALARCKDALLMAQGHYLSSSPRILLPWHLQAGVLLVSCLSAELLFRSVVLQVSGGWLTDRILEAGAEDWFLSAAAYLPVLPTPHMTGQLLAVGLLSGAWVMAVARQVLLASRRPSLLLASQGKVAAGQLLDSVRNAVTLNNAKQQQQSQHQGQHKDAQQQRQQGHSQLGASSLPAHQEQANSSSDGSSKTHTPSEALPTAAASGATDSKQLRSQAAAELAVAAAEAADAGSSKGGASSSSSSRPRGSRKSLNMALPNTLSALALSHMVTGVRDLSQSAGLGLAFALTGNLAASVVAAVLTEGLMAVLQRHGRERSRQRSIAFAKHFASFTRVFRDTQRKKLLEEQQQQQQQQQHTEQQEASVQPLAAAADMHAQDVLPLAAVPASDGDDALDTAVAAAVATETGAAPAPAGGVVGTRMERTISVLDQLLGEQLAEQAAAAGPHGGK